jgi:hypothetical protein
VIAQVDSMGSAVFTLIGALGTLGGVGLSWLLYTIRDDRRRAAERDRLDTPPLSDGLLLTGDAAREALGATLRQLAGEPDAPVLCRMSGQYVNHVGLIGCPATGCTRYVDVDPDGVVEPHWTKPALPLPVGRYEGEAF